jgi:glyoxylase-like metal-dependent hydrolase (beta-lactamase superfamily II)
MCYSFHYSVHSFVRKDDSNVNRHSHQPPGLTLDHGEPTDKLRGDYRGTDTEPTRTVREGERIGSLEVVASPGHMPGHIALLDTRDHTLFCGDTFSTLGGVATSAKMNPRFPLIIMGTWHRPTVIQSAHELLALEPARLAPGHGRIVETPASAMSAAIAQAS